MTAELTDWLIGVPTGLAVSAAVAVVVGSWLRHRPPADLPRRVDVGAALGVRRHPADIEGGGEL